MDTFEKLDKYLLAHICCERKGDLETTIGNIYM